MSDANDPGIYFQAEWCNLIRLAAVWTLTAPSAQGRQKSGHRGQGVSVSVCDVQKGRKRTWTPETAGMFGIAGQRSHTAESVSTGQELSHSGRNSTVTRPQLCQRDVLTLPVVSNKRN